MANALIPLQWVYGTLTTGDTNTAVSGRIHAENDVPQNVVHPYVVIRNLFPGDTQTINGTIVMHRPIFIVTAVNVSNEYESIEAIADAIATDLQGQSGSVSRGNVWYCTLEENGQHFQTYRDGDTRYVEMGGRYRVWSE